MQKKHLFRVPKRAASFLLASLMALSTVLTGCGSATDVHALSNDTAIEVTAVSDETVSMRKELSKSLDKKLAKEAAQISDEYWESDVPADEKAVLAEYAKNEEGPNVPEYKTGSSVDLDKVKASTVEDKFDKNGLKETDLQLKVMYTTVDKDYLKTDSITSMWNDNYDAFIANYNMVQHLYEAKGYDDCYVAFVNFSALNGVDGEIVSADFTRGTERHPVSMDENVVLDKEHGVLYVPKAWYFAGDGTEVGLDLAAQIMVAVDVHEGAKTDENGNLLANVSVAIENDAKKDVLMKDGQYAMIAYDYAILPLFAPGSLKDLDSDEIEVYINGSAEPLEASELAYSVEDGTLTINKTAITLADVKVVLKKASALKTVASLFSLDAKAGTLAQDHSGMRPIYNVSTGKELNPDIDIDSITIGDVFAYETIGNYGSRYRSQYQQMWDLGASNFVYTSNWDAGTTRSDTYWAFVGNIAYDINNMSYGPGKKDDYGFIIELPFTSTDKDAPNPVLIRSASNKLTLGSPVYFGQQDDWKWINGDYSSTEGEIRFNYSIPGQCSHTDTSTYEDGSIDFNSKAAGPGVIEEEHKDKTFRCYCSNCDTCQAYRELHKDKDGKVPDYCDGNCPTCKAGKCDECNIEWIGKVSHINAQATCRVLVKANDYMILGLAQLDSGDSQRGTSVIKVRTSVRVQVKKESSSTLNDGIVDNPCYADPTTAIYTIYRDEECTDAVGAIRADGKDTLRMRRGTYWIKETEAAVGYYINPTPEKIEIKKNTVLEVTDDPIMDPTLLMVQKDLQNRDTAGVTTGDVGDLSGIQFRVSYYKGEHKTIDSLPAEADESAIFETDKNGLLMINQRYLADGETWKYEENGEVMFPLGTIHVEEVSAIDGLMIFNPFGVLYTVTDMSDKTDDTITVKNYHGDITTYEGSSNKETSEDRVGGTYENAVMKGGVTVTKADNDWNKSDYQGDATLNGAEFTIYNRSETSVYYKGEIYEKDAAIDVLTTAFDEATGTYTATTGPEVLEYGTYEIKETKAPEGYNLADWSKTFTIREDKEMHYFTQDTEADTVNGLDHMHNWCRDAVMRGGVTFGKVDRETKQYVSLGGASLAGATFQIINRSEHGVYVDGTTYAPGEVVMELTSEELEIDLPDGGKKTIIGCTTGNNVLPYGTYDIIETGTGLGYLFDSNSKAQLKTFQIRDEGDMQYLTDEADAFDNKVQREDWYFSKKADDSGKEMVNVAWTVTSVTTGETHVIVTDENGKYQSDQVKHSQRTNANDPDSPISNGAIKIDEDGDYVVADASKLDYDAGTWFTGVKPEFVTWAEDGLSYTIKTGTKSMNGEEYTSVGKVDDSLRAYPYDAYIVQELASDANKGYNLVSFMVTLKRYNDDPDSNGIILDYGTVDNQHVDITTVLGYTESKFANAVKIVPDNESVELTDNIYYSGLTAGSKYTLIGEVHATDEEGNDLGLVASKEMTFDAKANGKVSMTFEADLTDRAGQILVATEELWQGKTMLAAEADLTNLDQSVLVEAVEKPEKPEVKPTLDGYAVNAATNAKELSEAADQSVFEAIKIDGMDENKQYKVEGSLYYVDENGNAVAVLDADGNPAVITKENPNAAETMTFTGVDAKDLGGHDFVVYLTLYERADENSDWTVSVELADKEDKDQMVWVPKIATELTAENGTHNVNADGTITLTDKVSYEKLTAGQKYTATGTLHVREDAATEDGFESVDMGALEGVTATAEFTPEAANGDMEVKLTFDASELTGKLVVAFEEISTVDAANIPEEWAEFFTDREVSGEARTAAVHADIADAKQAVGFANIKSTTLTTEDGAKITGVNGEMTLIDAVEYEGLVPGMAYDIAGALKVKGEDKDAATAATTLTPEMANGTVNVKFAFDTTGMDGKTVVAFESIKSGKTVIASHEDMDDAGQTVQFIGLDTVLSGEAKDEYKGETEDIPKAVVTASNILKNVVTPSNVEATEDENETDTTDVVTPSDVQKPATPSDADKTEDETATPSDAAKPVKNLQFTAYSGSQTEFGVGQLEVSALKLIDEVSYFGLTPGKEYTIKGEVHLRDAKTKEDMGNMNFDQSVTFTPAEANGKIIVTFTVYPMGVEKADIVAFDYLYDGDTLIASHADILDDDQAVSITAIKTDKPNTGEPAEKNPCGCTEPDCKHKDEKDHCTKPGCCEDSDCCKNCGTCNQKNPCGCTDPDCKHKDETDACKKPGCCEDDDCCKDCDDCKPSNACGCDDPNCKHKDEKDFCKKPGCCKDDDCCKTCPTCKTEVTTKNPCGCSDPDCKHKDEKDACKKAGCCDDADCCKKCDDCKPKNACGCDDPNCKHKDEKDACKKAGCCEKDDCCKNCTTCKKSETKGNTVVKPTKNPCGCTDANCKRKNEKDACTKVGCCDGLDCCKRCLDCKSQATGDASAKVLGEKGTDTVKTGEAVGFVLGFLGLALLFGGGYFYFGRTDAGREVWKKIREKFFKK